MADHVAAAQICQVHAEIDACRVCERVVPQMVKTIGLRRGSPGAVMVVGQAPGNHEAHKKAAFAGPSGKRLDSWLVRCGFPAENPRTGVYFTSVVKCIPPQAKDIPGMLHNCRHFLQKQLSLIQPRLVITLGGVAYKELAFTDVPYEQALCQSFSTAEHLLLSPFSFNFTLLAWPHPSGRNLWHNEAENLEALNRSFALVKRFTVQNETQT